MAYNEFLADRILQAFKDKGIEAVEKKMMGGRRQTVDSIQ